MHKVSLRSPLLCVVALLLLTADASRLQAQSGVFRSADLYQLKSVGDVQVSPNGTHIAYTVVNNDRPGRPYSHVWIMDAASGKSVRLGAEGEEVSGPRCETSSWRLLVGGLAPAASHHSCTTSSEEPPLSNFNSQ